jgi:acyl-CoA synthetase (NDP forming)
VVDPNGAVANPIDLIASATPEIYEQALRLTLADERVDAALVICTPTFAARPARVADVLCRVAVDQDKPVLGCFLAAPEISPLLGVDETDVQVPAFASPEPAARALARAAAYAEWRRRPPGAVPELDGFDPDRAHTIVGAFLTEATAGGWLPAERVDDLLGAAGIPLVRAVSVASVEQAGQAAAAVGLPVALKAVGPDLVHKSDVGGVQLDLSSRADVEDAYRDMASRLGERMTGAVVQQMARPGVETIVGVVQDPLFGPLVMFGLGGVATELLGDRAFRILPLTDLDAADLVRSLRASPLLFGYRGSAPVAVGALEQILQRVARLVERVAEIRELDLNPVIVSDAGAVAVDCRVRVAPVPPGPPTDTRRMD